MRLLTAHRSNYLYNAKEVRQMKVQQPREVFDVRPIGFINSPLNDLKDCPLQESENAPEAYLELYSLYTQGIKDISVGDKLIVLTWFHLADREILKCYKRNMVGSKEFGVFSTRSPDRPNPIGLHTVTVLEIVNEQKIKIFPIEALNGTPVIDVKPFI
jgi:tRNA-Thr(GGU) m(6)t(6)A37 methyltransferase TsaA